MRGVAFNRQIGQYEDLIMVNACLRISNPSIKRANMDFKKTETDFEFNIRLNTTIRLFEKQYGKNQE